MHARDPPTDLLADTVGEQQKTINSGGFLFI